MGIIQKALAGAGRGMVQSGLVQLESQPAELRAKRLAELEGKLRGEAYKQERADKLADEESRRQFETDKMYQQSALDVWKAEQKPAPRAGSAEVTLMDVLVDRGVAKDPKEAWSMIRSQRDDPVGNAIRMAQLFMRRQQEDMVLPGDTGYQSPDQVFDRYLNQFSDRTSQKAGKELASEAGAIGYNEALSRARAEAEDRAGWFSTDKSDFGPEGREAWITRRANELTGGKSGEIVSQPAEKKNQTMPTGEGNAQSPYMPMSEADYNAIPSGAIFRDPDDGQLYIKP